MRKRRSNEPAQARSLWPTLLLMIVALAFLLLFGGQLADRLTSAFVAPPPPAGGMDKLPPTLDDTGQAELTEPVPEREEPPATKTPDARSSASHSGAIVQRAIREASEIALRTLTR